MIFLVIKQQMDNLKKCVRSLLENGFAGDVYEYGSNNACSGDFLIC